MASSYQYPRETKRGNPFSGGVPSLAENALIFGHSWGWLCPKCNEWEEGYKTEGKARQAYLSHIGQHDS